MIASFMKMKVENALSIFDGYRALMRNELYMCKENIFVDLTYN